VGLGNIGMGYDYGLDPSKFVLSHARSFSIHPDFELVGGVDSDLKKCAEFEAEYKVPAHINLEKALKALSPTIVIIATPSNSHGLILKRILRSHVPKAIVCEKPLDESLAVARDMLKVCNDKSVKLFVNYMRRSEDSVIKIKTMIDDQVIQPPIKAFVWYSKGLLNNGSHMLNLLEYWLGEVLGQAMILSNSCMKNSDYEPDFKLNFKKGSAIFCAGWGEDFPHLTVELLSPSGRLYYSKGGADITWQQSDNGVNPSKNIYLVTGTKINNGFDCYQFNFAENLALALKGEKHYISTGQDALKTLASVYNIIYRSS